jgi:hypothetical protein
MGASNDLTALLVIVWVFGLMFVLASLFRPVPPFRSRTQAFFLGLPGILIGPFVIAIALGWAPAPRHQGGATVIAPTPKPQSASRPPEDAGPSPRATTDIIAKTSTTTPAAPSAPEIVGLNPHQQGIGQTGDLSRTENQGPGQTGCPGRCLVDQGTLDQGDLLCRRQQCGVLHHRRALHCRQW